MSEHFAIEGNERGSSNTRLPVFADFAQGRFNRDELAHVSRYLLVAEHLIARARRQRRGLKVLDIGCGEVPLARIFNRSFFVRKTDVIAQYVGLDIDYKSLSRAEENKPPSFPIELISGDVTGGALTQFRDRQFDVVVCMEVIEHLEPEFVRPLLSEICRVGHWACISTPVGSGKLPADHVKEWGYTELLAELARAGLEVEREIGIFCRIPDFQRAAKGDPRLEGLYHFLRQKMDSNFLSVTLARFAPRAAQNVLRFCRCGPLEGC